jgi:hypothetical protein
VGIGSYFGTAVQRTLQPLTPTSTASQHVTAQQDAGAPVEVVPSSTAVFRSDDVSDWGELETTASPPPRFAGNRRAAPFPHQAPMGQSPAPPRVAPPSEARPLRSPSPVSAQPVDKAKDVRGGSMTAAANGAEATTQPLHPSDNQPPATERSPERSIPDATPTLPHTLPSQHRASLQEATQALPREMGPPGLVTPPPASLVTPPSRGDAHQERPRVVLAPKPQLIASATAPSMSAPEGKPRAPSPAPADTPRLTIGRIEVEVVTPPTRQERAAASPPARTLSRAHFDAIGLAQR